MPVNEGTPMFMDERQRHLWIRIIGTPILLGAVVAPLWWDHERGGDDGLAILLAIVSAVSLWEFYALCRMRGYRPDPAGILAVAAVMIPGNDPYHVRTLLVGFLLLRLVFSFPAFRPEDAALSLLGVLYIGSLGFLTSTAAPTDADQRLGLLLFLLATAKGSDIAAFCVGKMFGRRAMAPKISPNKTWEGAVAGGVAGTAAGFFVWSGFSPMDVPRTLILAFVVTCAAQIGDLVESAFKRWAGAKDSGRIPGFGGLLDMTDSFYLSVPATFGTLSLLNRVV